jgi:lipoprotein NlpD
VNPAKAVLVVLVLAVAVGCATRRTPAPVIDARTHKHLFSKSSAAPAAQRASSEFHTVRRGDTVYSIALEHGLDHREIAQWNGIDDPARLRIGQQLRVKAPPGAAAAAVEPERVEAPAVQVGSIGIVGRVESRPLETLPPLPAREPPKSEISRMQLVKAAPAPAAPAKSATPTPSPASQFMWPVKGKVLAEFAEPRRKGIDIDGRPGDPIVAAAPGRVTYIGSGIPGMGKLVVIKHDNGFITVYAHNRNILVKESQAVAQGQRIAELGSTDAERPKLHFQIRKGAAAVDPLLYLPK